MGVDKPGWYYVGNGQLRYMDGDGWTDQYKRTDDPYKPIDEPPVRARPLQANTEPVNRVSPSAATTNKPPGAKKPRRRTSLLVIAVCVGLVGVGGGLLRPDVFHGATSWAAEQAGQISALISPPAPTPQAIAAKPKAKAKAKAPKAAAPKAVAPKAVAPKAVAPKAVAPKAAAPKAAAPGPVAPRKPSPVPAPVSRPAPAPPPTTHTRTAADCLGNIVAISEIRITATTATLVGTVTNETGLDANLSVSGPVVEAWDTNSTHVRLYGDYRATPDPFGEGWAGVLHPGQSISYHSLPVTMQTPDRNWDAVRWSAINQFDNYDDQIFCQQRWIDGIHIVR
jgi:hypothetical protein